MATLFTDLLAQGVRKGQLPARTQQAREWYRSAAKDYSKRINDDKFFREDRDRLTSRPLVGNMYMFYYSPKHRAKLPYYDRFPLVFPFKKVKGGFLGLNLHYLPLQYRATLMDALYDTVNNKNYDETTKLKINYSVLSSVSKFEYFKPCIKHYLTGQLSSRFMYVYPSEWDMALMLPLERFQKASKTQVWADSRKMIR